MLSCCVPYCYNTSLSSESISFHEFPTKPYLRASWLKILNKSENNVPEDAVVCSEHFLFTDFYVVDGIKKLWYDALPIGVQLCIICLNIDCKLVSISQYKLKPIYENLTGLKLSKEANLCVECALKLLNFKKFRDKSLRASSLLEKITQKHKIIKKEHIQSINRERTQLSSNLIRKVYKPNHCDLYVVEYTEGDRQEELDNVYDGGDNTFIDYGTDEVEFENGELLQDNIKVENVEIDNDGNTKQDLQDNDNNIVWNEPITETDISNSIIDDKNDVKEELLQYNMAFKCTACNRVYLDMHLLKEHLKTHSYDQSGIDSLSTSQRSDTTQYNVKTSEEECLNGINAGSNYVELKNSSNTFNEVETYILDYTNIRPEDESYKQVLAYNVNTNDIVENKKIINNCKILNKKGDKNLQVLTNNANEKNSTHVTSEIADENSKTKNRFILSYDENTDNVVIDTIQTDISESEVFLDKVHFDEQECINETDSNNLDVQVSQQRDVELFCCHICSQMFTVSEDLQDHMQVHTGTKPYACRFCDFRSTHRGSLQRHEMSHQQADAFHCHYCSVTFNHKRDLMEHLKTHVVDKPYSCGVCHRTFVQKGNLLTHMRIHTGEKPYSCKYCDYKCIQRKSLVEHEKIHKNEFPYRCNLCEFKCSSRGLLVKHWKIHINEVTSSEAMKEHCDNIDPNDKLYMCKLCVKMFSNKYNYRAHMNMHTGENTFACHYCGKKFAIKGNLVFHLRTHTGEKPYTCEICHYKFSTSTNFKRHLKIHTGEKPYSCALCPYKSVQSNDIRAHMKSHSDERPFACELCDYRCKARRTLGNHMRIHTGEPPQRKVKDGEPTTEVQRIEDSYTLIDS